MIINTKLELEKFIKLMYVLTYRKPIMILITIIGITMLVGSLGYLFGFKDLYSDSPYVPGLLGFVFVVVFPFSI